MECAHPLALLSSGHGMACHFNVARHDHRVSPNDNRPRVSSAVELHEALFVLQLPRQAGMKEDNGKDYIYDILKTNSTIDAQKEF